MSIREVMDAQPNNDTDHNNALSDWLATCADCVVSCSLCSDACLLGTDEAQMMDCITSCADCADMCTTTIRIISRMAHNSQTLNHAIISACVACCLDCAETCEKYAHIHERCRQCAETCRKCLDAYHTLMNDSGLGPIAC